MPVLVVLQSCSFCKLIMQIVLVWYQMRSCANASLCSGMLHRGPYLEGYFSALQKTNGRTQIIFCSTLFRNAPPSLLTWLGHRTIPLKFVLMEPNLTKSYYIANYIGFTITYYIQFSIFPVFWLKRKNRKSQNLH